jgi:hypothetical protein
MTYHDPGPQLCKNFIPIYAYDIRRSYSDRWESVAQIVT